MDIVPFQRSVDARTELRLLSPQNSDELFNLIDQNRSYLRKYLPWVDTVRTVSDSRKFVQTSVEQFERKAGMQVGIWFQSRLVGVVGFQKIDQRNKKVSLGFWLEESAQGAGIMTQSCRAMVSYAFHELNLNRASLRFPSSNTRARKLAERLGFTYEGDLKQAEWFYDHFEDNTLYGVLASSWG